MTDTPEVQAGTHPTTPAPSYADRLVQQERAIQGDQATRRAQGPYRSGRTRAKALVALLWVSFAASLIASATNIWGWLTLDAYGAGRASVADLETFDAVFAGYGLVETGIFIAAAIAWLAWQSRTIDNEGPLRIGPPPWSPAMSIVWWFVPFANLVQPYRIQRHMWTSYVGVAGVGLVLWWWITYLGSSIVTNAAGRLWLIADTIDTLQTGLLVWLVADVVGAVSVFPAVALVTRIQRGADALAAIPPQPLEPADPPPVGAP
jgi:hypothetical protein